MPMYYTCMVKVNMQFLNSYFRQILACGILLAEYWTFNVYIDALGTEIAVNMQNTTKIF